MKVTIFAFLALVSVVMAAPQNKQDPKNIDWSKAARDSARNDGQFKYGGETLKHGGVNLYGEARHNLYTSPSGNTRIEGRVMGERDFGGPTNGRGSYGYGGRLEHTWGR